MLNMQLLLMAVITIGTGLPGQQVVVTHNHQLQLKSQQILKVWLMNRQK